MRAACRGSSGSPLASASARFDQRFSSRRGEDHLVGLVGAVAPALPDHLDLVATHRAIGADERQALSVSLGDEKAVERVLVVHRQRSDPVGDRQEAHICLLDADEEVGGGIELSKPTLDCNLPDHDGR
jgi:hypothetical protein